MVGAAPAVLISSLAILAPKPPELPIDGVSETIEAS
jgi:hypothetical protein